MKGKLLIVFLCFSFLLTACDKETSNDVDETVTADTEIQTINLYTGIQMQDLAAHEFEYSGALTPGVLGKGLSDLTGLDFAFESKMTGNDLYIDWSADSTLVAGLGDREQNEDFFFHDSDSMRWFMMDSLMVTLKENLNMEDIYYTMDGGQELELEGLYPTNIIPSDFAYEGYMFFLNHADGMGDMDDMEQDGRGDYIEDDQGGRGDYIEDDQDGRGDYIEDDDIGDMSDPGDTGRNEWWGVYVNYDLGFSIEITEFNDTDFWFVVYLLRNGNEVLSGRATITGDDDHLAMMGDIGLYLYEDFSAIDFMVSESSEWEHMRGQYTLIE